MTEPTHGTAAAGEDSSVRAVVVLYVPPIQESLDFRGYQEHVSGHPLLHWFCRRRDLPGPVMVLCHGPSEARRLRRLIADEQLDASVYETSQPTRTDAYLELAMTVAAADLVACELPYLFAPDGCASAMLREHRTAGATVTTAGDLPEHVGPVIISANLLRSIAKSSFPSLPPEPAVMFQLLLESGADREFGLPLTQARVRTGMLSEVTLHGVLMRPPLSAAQDVEALRNVVGEDGGELAHPSNGADSLLCRWRDALADLVRQRRRAGIAEWRRSIPAAAIVPVEPIENRIFFASAPSAVSGAERSICALVDALRKSPFEAHALLSLDGEFARGLREAGAVVHCHNVDFSIDSITNFFFCLNILRTVRPALIHANGLMGYPMMYAAALLGVPLLQHVRVPFPERLYYQLDVAARVVTVSSFVKRRVVQLGVAGDKVDVVFNGVDLKYFDAARPVDAKTQAYDSARPCVVTLIARGAPNKRHDLFIEALDLAHRTSRIPIRGLIVTEHWEDPVYCRQILGLIEQHELRDVITVIGFQRDIRTVWTQTDVLVVCSDDEPLSRAILEAMAMRVPVIATDAGGSNEMIQDERTGLLIEHDNAARLGEAIVRLAQDEPLRRSLAAAARERVASLFTAELCARNTMDVYTRVLGERPPAALHPPAELMTKGGFHRK